MKKNAIVPWEEEMQKDAKVAAAMEEGVGVNFFSTKSGTLSWMDNPMKDNEMTVIIIGR